MYTADDLNAFIKDILNLLNKPISGNHSSSKPNGPLGLSPSQGLVVAGLMLGLFEVTSVLISKDSVVQIVLSGSLQPGVAPSQIPTDIIGI